MKPFPLFPLLLLAVALAGCGKWRELTACGHMPHPSLVETVKPPEREDNSIVGDNVTDQGSGGLGGGGILSSGTLTVRDSLINLNHVVEGHGGGVMVGGGTTVLERVQINDNTATVSGGGLAVQAAVAQVSDSTLSGNSTWLRGGGVHAMLNRWTTVENSTISDNELINPFGLIPGIWAGGGGLTASDNALVELYNSTLSSNHSVWEAGGLGAVNGPSGAPTVQGDQVTIADNTSVTAPLAAQGVYCISGVCALQRSLVDDGCQAVLPGVLGSVENSAMSTCGYVPGVLGLAALANNGGPTQTHAITTSSDAYQAAACSAGEFDQRGQNRSTPLCDAGAFEAP